ncbi:MAG: ABC transporter permease [Lacisediminihabitans sp.]
MSTIQPARLWRTPIWGGILAVALIAELVWFSLINRNFFGGGVGMLTQIESFIPTGILAMASALVIFTGNIDLSVGAIASLASVVVGTALLAHVNIIVAILLAIAVSTLIGLINGLIVTLLGIDSLLVTLATQFIASSVAVSLAGNNPPSGFAADFLSLGGGTIGPVPVILIIFVLVSVAVALLVGRTRFGRRTVLVGYNPSAARYTGIPVARTVVGVFTLSGVIAGIGGVVLAAYFNAGRSDSGLALLLPAITCVVLGGVDIFGGRGRIGEVFVAVLLLGYLTQGMLNAGFSSLTASMVTGILLIVALVIKIAVERPGGDTLLGAIRHRVTARAATLVRKR